MDIVLTTINARYAHTAFGLRYLKANLGELAPRTRILEFDLTRDPLEIVDLVLRESPRLVGLGVYIWNVAATTRVVAALKRLRPELTLVLGGPEVSHETESQAIVALADHVITGEADLEFAQLARRLLAGERSDAKILRAEPPTFEQLVLPYDLYDEEDVAQRVLYVEASRGCPFQCEFCLSSLDDPVRHAPLEPFLAALERLLARGARRFKFVDRTFNLNQRVAQAILEFFLARAPAGLALHFEMVPDRFPPGLRAIVQRFSEGVLQFEVGVQTFSPEVARLISRPLDVAKLEDNLTFLRAATPVHVHADLIAGLPGESLESFAAGFDRLVALGPQEIQIELLKRLRGTPIVRHDQDEAMVYAPDAPYEVLSTRRLDFAALRRLHRFARVWDLCYNSGNFVGTVARLWTAGGTTPFAGFLAFCDWLEERAGRTHAIALLRLMELMFEYLTQVLHLDARATAQELWLDYQRGGRSDRPRFLLEHIADLAPESPRGIVVAGKQRQERHRRRRPARESP